MKVLFVRHGESQDDVDNQYGGWSDFPLTNNGNKQIRAKIPEIKKLKIDFDRIYSSPLQRALKSAKIISTSLKIPVETLEYVKERNTYGLLSGMEKRDAKKKYPNQVERLEKDKYVDGSERYKDMTSRVIKSVKMLKQSNNNIVVLTHGNYLKCMFSEVLNKKLTKKEDGGFVLVEFDNNKSKILDTSGINYE